MKCIRPKPYVKIKLKLPGGVMRWYWAIKIGPNSYRRVKKDGDTEMKSQFNPEGIEVITEEILLGEPTKEKIAVMNLHYGELEVIK